MSNISAGKLFQKAIEDAKSSNLPLHIVGVADGSDALEAKRAGFKAIYISGSQVAASRGWADIGRTGLKDLLININLVMASGVDLPLLVDIDTGFDNVAETIKAIESLGVAAVHLEDQADLKSCGHLPGKQVISKDDAADRIKKAVAAKADSDFIIMARTDALAVEGLEKTLERITAYSDAGADMIFAEAFSDVSTYAQVKKAAGGKAVLSNMTEFGKVELQTPKELYDESAGVIDMVLNPLSVYRAQRKTAAEAYKEIYETGSQRSMEDKMQRRENFKSLVDYEGQVKARSELLKKAG